MPINPNLLERLIEANTPAKPHDSQNALAGVALEVANSLETYPDALEVIQNYEIHEAFAGAHSETSELFERIGITVPPLDEFAGAGVDFSNLAAEYEYLETLELEPSVVFTNANPTYQQLKALYRSLYENWKIGGADNEGLKIHDEVQKNWTLVTIPYKHLPHVAKGDQEEWTVNIVSATNQLPKNLRSVPHHISSTEDPRLLFSHPTMSEYLTLQARRLAAGESPLLGRCWLLSEYLQVEGHENIRCAAFGQIWSADNDMYIGWNDIKRTHSMDARPTVGWGG